MTADLQSYHGDIYAFYSHAKLNDQFQALSRTQNLCVQLAHQGHSHIDFLDMVLNLGLRTPHDLEEYKRLASEQHSDGTH